MRGVVMALVLLAGCGVFRSVKDGVDKVKGATRPLVAQGSILDVAPPADPALDPLVAASGIEVGTTAQLLLADSVTEPDAAPLAGALATLRGSTTARFEEVDDGVYAVGPDAGLTYQVGAVWRVEVVVDGEEASISAELPPPADVQVPANHPLQADLVLDFTGQGYQAALVVVVDQAGTVTWTNEPQDMAEAIAFAGKGEDLELLVVPGLEAFQAEAAYVVGVAGLRTGLPEDIEHMNTLLSGLRAGQMAWYPTSTLPVP